MSSVHRFGICHLSVAPVRAEASHRSEMTTQLLFGEHFEIYAASGEWKKIRIFHDDYEGWVHERQYRPIDQKEYQRLCTATPVVTTDLVEVVSHRQEIFPVLLGSTLPSYDEEYCYISGEKYSYDGNVRSAGGEKSTLVENAYMYRNAPYLWGGRSPFGIDCSGLVQMVYKLSGIRMKRDAFQQAEQGLTLGLVSEAEPGDLAFFDNEEGKITHVGIILSDNRIIHASAQVRVDKLDPHGIFNTDTQRYTHKLRTIKRVM